MSQAGNPGRILLTRHSDVYRRISIDIPPLNIFGLANIPQLEEIVPSIETDEQLEVVVFDSAVDGFFMALRPVGEARRFCEISGRQGRRPCQTCSSS
ncbi:MAG: hypothetical protein WB919_06130 [Candidatus Sulfotelmatobacter sp.]